MTSNSTAGEFAVVSTEEEQGNKNGCNCKCSRRTKIFLAIFICVILTVGLILLLYYIYLETDEGHNEANRVYYNVWSHNDFAQDVPLTDALDSHVGFLEVDCFLYASNGSFFVAHDAEDIDAETTLSSLYLDPLLQRIEDSGTVWGGSYAQELSNFSLNINIEMKNLGTLGASAVYAALDDLIREKYTSIVSYYDSSLNVTMESYVYITMENYSIYSVMVNDSPADNRRYISYGGLAQSDLIDLVNVDLTNSDFEVSDLNYSDYATVIEMAVYMPTVSAEWGALSGLDDDSSLTSSEETIITNMLKLCYFLDIRLRFWGLSLDPNFALFDQLLELDVEYQSYIISTDYPAITVDYIEENGF